VSTTNREPQNDIDYVGSVGKVGLVMEEYLMLQNNSLRRINLQVLRTKSRRGSICMKQTKQKINPTIVDQEGSLAPRNQRKRKQHRVRLLSIQTRKSPWRELPILWWTYKLKRASVPTVVRTTMHGTSAKNQLCLHPPKATGQISKMTIQKMSCPWQE